MTLQEETMLQELKLRLNDITEEDALLLSYIREVLEKIKDYCNLPAGVPEGLFYTVVSMAAELFLIRIGRHVKSESQGQRSVSYIMGGDLEALLPDYKNALNRYRRIKAV